MDTFLFALNVVLPMCIIMVLGYVLKKLNFYDDKFLKNGNMLVFKLFLPLMLFKNIYSSDFKQNFNLRLLIFVLVMIAVVIALSFIIVTKVEKDNKKRGAIIQAIFRSNFVIYGLPLCTNMFGQECVSFVSSIIAFIIPLYNFMAVVVLSVFATDEGKKLDVKKVAVNILKNPLIIASVFGIIFSCFRITLPSSIEKAVTDIGKIATPLALLFLGGEFEIKTISKYKVETIIVTLLRLIAVPCVVLCIAIALGFTGYELGTVLTIFATPVAISSYVMALQMGSDADLAGILVMSTTLCSAFSLFIIVFILKYFCFI